MRRSASLLLAAIVLLSVNCGDDGGSSPDASTSGTSGAETKLDSNISLPRLSRFVELTKCRPSDLPHGGGYDIGVRGVRCVELGRLLPRLGLPIGRNDPHAGIFERGGGWTCWSQYLDTNGPVQNVCWQGKRLVVYKVA